jgi:hypothetical protein
VASSEEYGIGFEGAFTLTRSRQWLNDHDKEMLAPVDWSEALPVSEVGSEVELLTFNVATPEVTLLLPTMTPPTICVCGTAVPERGDVDWGTMTDVSWSMLDLVVMPSSKPW